MSLPRNLTQPIGKRPTRKAIEDVRAALRLLQGANFQDPHGWRYTATRPLAEAGYTDSEIQGDTGNKTLAMVQKNRAQAKQRAASKRAQQRRDR